MRKTPLRKISEKQKVRLSKWQQITAKRAEAMKFICEWCGKPGRFSHSFNVLDGHHIKKRSQGGGDTYDNCFICHRLCHAYITDYNIDVSKTKFADLPSAGIWKDRTESDEELLKKLGGGWRGLAAKQ